jgi:hypothetical protein
MKALVIVFSNLKSDARVTRQVSWLKKRFSTTVVCFDADDNVRDVEIIKLSQTPLTLTRKILLGGALLTRQFDLAYKLFHSYDSIVAGLNARDFDLIIANDIDALPLAFRINKNGKILFDAHEYAPRHFEDKWIWRTFFQPFNVNLCKLYIPRVDGMLTVGKGLADEYEKNFGVTPVIITNATNYHDISTTPCSGKIKLIHHGIANQSRRLELMIELMDMLDDRFTLDMILMTSTYASGKTKAYIATLKDAAARNGRIRILPGVKSNEVVKTIRDYDMGVFLIPPINFNYANTLPNKLFEFIQARLGIAIGPTPEMANIVRKYDVGVVADDFTPASLARKLNALSPEDINRFKSNASRAALDLNAEKNEEIFNDLLKRVLPTWES